MTKYYNNPGFQGNNFADKKFDIRNFVEFDASGRAICPNCGTEGGKKNLSVQNGGQYDGAYKCFKCDDPEAIRAALGESKPQIIPTALAKPPKQKKKTLVPESVVLDYATHLLTANSEYSFSALKWLKNRGILPEIAKEYKLGLARSRYEGKFYWGISIPIPSEGKYYVKKRLVPWEADNPIQKHRAWSQYGIPKTIYFTHNPENAQETWLCEGEWDAILLGWLVKHFCPKGIAVASFTCGCKNIPPQEELDRLPGEVTIFYDRNDKILKGERIGDRAAKDVCLALGDRAKIADVPMPEDCTVKGWDVSDAINHGYRFDDFELAASQAKVYREEINKQNSFRSKLVSARTIFDRAPDYVEELWTDFFSCNELYLLAAPPRLGKSLFTLALAKAVATGTPFLGRPTKKGKVVIVSKEDAEDKLKERMIAQSWGDEEFENISFQNEFTLNDLPDLIEYLEEEKPALLILDTLTRIRSDNFSENDTKLAQAIAPLQETAQKNGVCVVVVHHTSKGGLIGESRQEIFDKVRGTGSLRNVCRGMVVLLEGKNFTRLVSENGRTNGKDLKIHLSSHDLIWRDLGKWHPPNVDISQKEQVLDWLRKNKFGQVVQISKELDIHPKTTHKILTRLISENLVFKQGERVRTMYYPFEFDRFDIPSGMSKSSNVDISNDINDFSSIRQKQKNPELNIESEQVCKEVLKNCSHLSEHPKKNNFVELGDKNGQSIGTLGKSEFDTNSTNPVLSNLSKNNVNNEACSHFSQPVHIENTTKKIEEKVNTQPSDNAFSEQTRKNESCTNKEDELNKNSELAFLNSSLRIGDRVKGKSGQRAIANWLGYLVDVRDSKAVVRWDNRDDLNLVSLENLEKIE